MIKKAIILILILLYSTTAFAFEFTDNYRLYIPGRGDRDWLSQISNDLISIDSILKMVSDDSGSTEEIAILSADVNDNIIKIAILSADATVQDEKLDILSADAVTQDEKLDIISSDAVAQDEELDILSDDAVAQDEKLDILSSDAISVRGALVNADSYSSFLVAINSVDSGTTLLISTSQDVTSNLVIRDDIKLMFVGKGNLNIDNGILVSISCDIVAGPWQIFPQGGTAWVPVEFPGGAIDYGYVEWWGGVASQASPDVTDSWRPFWSAMYSGADIQLLEGWYGITNRIDVPHDGQKLSGAGRIFPSSAADGGTGIWKISGTEDMVKVPSRSGCEVSDLSLFGNGLAGNMLWDQGFYTTFERLLVRDQGGTDYAMVIDEGNIGHYEDIVFWRNYGHVYIDHTSLTAGFATFEHCTFAEIDGGHGIEIQGSTVGTRINNSQFEGDSTDNFPDIYVHGTTRSTFFNNVTLEHAGDSTYPLVRIEGSGTDTLKIDGFEINSGANTNSMPMISVDASQNISFTNGKLTDVSLAGRPLINLTGNATGIVIDDILVSAGAEFTFINCPIDRCDNIRTSGCRYLSTPVGLNQWKAVDLTVIDTNMPQIFLSGSSNRIYMENIAASVDTVNAGFGTYINVKTMNDGANNAIAIGTSGISVDVAGLVSADAYHFDGSIASPDTATNLSGVIYVDGATGNLRYYDPVNKEWKKVTLE